MTSDQMVLFCAALLRIHLSVQLISKDYLVHKTENVQTSMASIHTCIHNTALHGFCKQDGILRDFVDLHLDLKNSKWRIQYGGQINLINFYKPRPSFWLSNFVYRSSLEFKKFKM